MEALERQRGADRGRGETITLGRSSPPWDSRDTSPPPDTWLRSPPEDRWRSPESDSWRGSEGGGAEGAVREGGGWRVGGALPRHTHTELSLAERMRLLRT